MINNKMVPYKALVKNNDCGILSAQINLTNICNSKCMSCRKYTWPRIEINFNDLKRALTYLAANGLQTVVFSGGDPMLYSRFEEVVALCQDLKIKYSIITDLIFKNDSRLELMAKTAQRIHVSLDAADRELYKKIRGADGFELVEENIGLINKVRHEGNWERIEMHDRIRLSCTVSNLNYNHLIEIEEFAIHYGCDLKYYMVHTWDELKLNIDQIDYVEKFMRDSFGDYDNGSSIKPIDNCYIKDIHCLIDSDGSIYPCCKLLNDNGYYDETKTNAYGNISTAAIIALEFDKRFKLPRKMKTKCNLCNECSSRYIELNKELDSPLNPIWL